MGDDIQNAKTTAEDLAIERAEQQLADPAAANMQFLQSTVTNSGFDGTTAGSGFLNAGAKPLFSPTNYAGSGFTGLAPAYSGAGLLGAVSAVDAANASSAMGMAAQVASAAPVTFGKSAVGDAASLAGLGDKALAQPGELVKSSDNVQLIKSLVNSEDGMQPASAEFTQLMAMLEGPGNGLNPDDALASLIDGLGQNPSAENIQSAIDAVVDQISLLNNAFEPVFDNLATDVQSQLAVQDSLPSTDLGLSIFDDAGEVSTTLTDLLGTVDAGSIPQIDGLLGLDGSFDDIASLIGSLPDLDLTPITDPITDVVGGITDIVGGITDPVTDIVGGITDPVTDIVGGITDPVTDIIGDITDPVTDPITDIVDGVLPDLGLLSGLSTSSSGESDAGLLDSLSSGISSSAGSEGGALDGLLGALDPNK